MTILMAEIRDSGDKYSEGKFAMNHKQTFSTIVFQQKTLMEGQHHQHPFISITSCLSHPNPRLLWQCLKWSPARCARSAVDTNKWSFVCF